MRPLVCLLLVAAAFPAWSAPASAEGVTINFLNSERPDVYAPVIAEFERRNPGITVRDQSVPFEQLNAQVQARVGAGDSSVDVYGVDEPRVPALASRKLLVDLSALRGQVEAAATPQAVAATSYGGKLYALPEWTSTQVLFYNRDLLAKAGIAPPSSDPAQRMTWDTLLADAKKVQAAGAKWGFGFDQVDRYYQLQPLFESSGAGPGLTGDRLLTPDVNSAKWVKTMAWYGDLTASGLAPRGITPQQMPDLFQSGQIGFFVGGPWNFRPFGAAAGLHFGIAPHPFFAGGKPVTPTDSWAVGISPHSKHQAEALKFATFMTLDTAGDLLTTAQNPLPPANKAAFTQHVAQVTKAGGASTAPYGPILDYELGNTAVSRPRTTGYVLFEEIMNRAFSDVRNGTAAQPALDRAEGQLKAGFSRLR